MRTTSSGPRSFVSFTGARSPRYPAPDVARGFMLLLIALAHASFWTMWWPEAAEPTTLGTAWEWVRGALVDQRSYPLFAMLFGFGLMVMARRRIEHDVESLVEANRTYYDSLPANQQAAFLAAARKAATIDARRMVRRRGWWMLVFGGVHSLFFFGDIIGAYGLIAVIFAGTFVHQRTKVQWIAGTIAVLLCAATMVWGAWTMVTASSGDAVPTAGMAHVLADSARSPWYPLISLGMWLYSTPMTLLASTSLPATFIGAWVARTDLLTHPERHRRRLISVGIAGLTLATITSIPFRALLTGAELPLWLALTAGAVSMIIGGLAGGCAWLALLAVFAGGARADDQPLTGVRWLLAAVGKRSMTAYLTQTICFVLVYGTLAIVGTRTPRTVETALVAVALWLLIAGLCVLLERSGRRGPFERMLRSAVARTARRSKLSQLMAPVPAGVPAQSPQPQPMRGTIRSGTPSGAIAELR